MPRSLAVTPLVTGEPVLLELGVSSVAVLLEAVSLGPVSEPRYLAIQPRVGLVHTLVSGGPLALRWVRFARPCRLGGETGSVDIDIAIVMTSSLRESGRALRLVSRLKAGLRDAALVERAGAARTREELVRILAVLDDGAGETPLADDELFALLGTGRGGLDPAEAAKRLADCGPNRLERVRSRSLIARFLEQFVSLFAVLLWVAGGFALLAGMPELAWAIFAVIVINGVFSFLQEFRAERALEALQDLLPREITTIRGGVESRIHTADLVPGDLLRLDEGDQMPADGQLLAAQGLRVDQSALTGESHPIFKLPLVGNARERVPRLERSDLVFAGSGVVAGGGICVVTATSMGTEIGDIAHLTQAVVQEPSPLQRETARVTRVVTVLAVVFGVGFFALGTATGLLSLGEGFLFALGVVVANVPEGLLPTLTLALALAVQHMARRGSLIKRLSAVEALGAATVICTDKTGTLTEGRMAARALWVSGRVVSASEIVDYGGHDARALLEGAVLASVATTERGDPTEVALVLTAVSAGIEPAKLRAERELRAARPFDSFRKRMTLVRSVDNLTVAYVKGAPRETLALCDRIHWNDRVILLTDELRHAVLADHDRLAGDGLRLLAVASRPIDAALADAPQGMIERQLIFLGLIALWDPPRPEVPEAIAMCQRAGIRVVVVTGDYGLTGAAIARRIGLSVEKVVTGEELDRMSPETLRDLLREPGVLFARTSPAHKLTIVNGLKTLGEVVAVTGDGVNDAPALKAAAIGVAMGRRGSEVAKEAAEMVITDDNFASIVSAVRQGRAIYSNMGKFITYIFASNVPELVPFLAFVLFGIPLPLTVMQILAVDLGTDLLPALALAAEPAEADVMDRPPRAGSDRLLGPGRLLRAYAFLGLIEAALAMTAFFWTYWVAGWRPGLPMDGTGELYRRATTMTFAAIVAAQVGNVFACRTERQSVFSVGLSANRMVFVGVAAEIAILLSLILIAPLRHVFGLALLAPFEWGILLLFPPVILLLDETRKALLRPSGSAVS